MILAFRDIEVDTGRGELRRCGESVHTGPRVLNLLYLLASNADRLVTKEEIVDKVWDGRAVSDSAISTVVKEARKATGDDGVRQEVIRTLHGVGFRCVAPVRIRAPADPHQGEPCEAVARTLPGGNLRFSGKPSIAVLPFLDQRPEAATHHLGDTIPAEFLLRRRMRERVPLGRRRHAQDHLTTVYGNNLRTGSNWNSATCADVGSFVCHSLGGLRASCTFSTSAQALAGSSGRVTRGFSCAKKERP